MQYPPPNPPSQNRPLWVYLLVGCGGCSCAGVVAAFAAFFLLGMGVKKGLEGMSSLAREAQVDLKVQNHKMVDKQGKRSIVGTVKNISPTHTYGVAGIEFYLYDKSGVALDSAAAQTQNLKPGATWEFKAPVTDAAAVTYKFREVTGFQDRSEDPSLDPETRKRIKEQQAELDRRLKEIIKGGK